MWFLEAAWGQFRTLPYPDEDCTGRTVIVTGANVGLGLEAARHFVRLNASKVILACRSLDRGESARQDIDDSTKRPGVAEVWQLDLSSFDSVKEFADRARKLDRLDILVNNASVAQASWQMAEGHELQITVNLISTLLLSVLLLPTLRRSGAQFNITPHLAIVSSSGAFTPFFPERKSENIVHTLDTNEALFERYNLSKLLQLMVARKLAQTWSPTSAESPAVIINALNPGLCKTQLFRQIPFPVSLVMNLALTTVGRNAEMGSRTLMAAAFAGPETHGRWMCDCEVRQFPALMLGEEGERVMDKLWRELLDVLEGIEPGVTAHIRV